ncbi:hypothetical protein [Thiomicrorhabdus sp.]|uniref:hypothetical protein n=1 Tax=Thiomicrorhabdus sp. TaxID=2039724 RepID=UPI00356369AF
MFKKLFLILFLFQTLSSAAWGAMSVPFYSSSEQIEMKIMHQMMHMDSNSMAGENLASVNMSECNDNQEIMSCDQCDSPQCHSLLCASVHVAPVFGLTDSFQLDIQPLVTAPFVTYAEVLVTTPAQPELPPPTSASI